MKEKILTIIQTTIDKITNFYWMHPMITTFLAGVILGLLIAFIF